MGDRTKKYFHWREVFAKSAQYLSSREGDLEKKKESEWVAQGVKNLKRQILGFIGSKKIVSLENLAQVLVSLKMAETPEEARGLIPSLYAAHKFEYGKFGGVYLTFTQATDNHGKEMCRVERYRDSMAGIAGV